MKRKKILAGLLAAAMMLGVTGCSLPFGEKEPTAEELIAGMDSIDREKYNDMEVKLLADMSADGQPVSLELTAMVETKGDLAHLYDTSMSIGLSGLNMEVQMEGWLDYAENVSYMNMTAMGQESGWAKSTIDQSSGLSDMTELTSMFKDVSVGDSGAVLAEHTKGQDYVLEWVVDAKELSDSMSSLMESYGAESIDWDALSVTASFDESTRQIKSVSVKANVTQDGTDADMVIEFRFLTLNGDNDLSIPADVIDNAVDEGLSYGDGDPDDSFGGFGEDDGFDYDTQTGVVSDGDGYDAEIDAMAELLAARQDGTVYTYHYDSFASLSYHVNRDDWYGTMDVDRIFGEYYASPQDLYESQYDWLETSWYTPENRVEGSREDTYALFVRADEDGGYEMDAVLYDSDFYIEVSIYDYSGDMDSLMAHLNEMMNAIVF